MRYLLLAVLAAVLPFASADTVLVLDQGESVMATCAPAGTPDCTDASEPDEYGTHGATHAWAAEHGNQDCRQCHGADLRGTSLSMTSKRRNCAAPDGFVPPVGMPDVYATVDPYGINLNTTGTAIGIMEAGSVVGCYSCHDEVEFTVNGREYEFENLRRFLGSHDEDDDDDGDCRRHCDDDDDDDDEAGDTGNSGGNSGGGSGGSGPAGPVFNCALVHNAARSCSNCHNDGRTCE